MIFLHCSSSPVWSIKIRCMKSQFFLDIFDFPI
nr:MAG TPA: TIP41-like protein, LEU-TYR-PHE-GLN binding TIP41-like family PP2A [Caudoviricetes sp.]